MAGRFGPWSLVTCGVLAVSVAVGAPVPGWSTETVESAGSVGFFNSLAYSPVTGFPSIAYSDEAHNPAVKLATWTGASWSIQTVDAGRGVNVEAISLAIDSAGNPAVSYGSGQLKFARWTGSAWSIQAVSSSSGTVSSLVLKDGQPWIAFTNVTKKGNKTVGQLKLARLVGSGWTIETVEDNVDPKVLYPSLAFGPDGNPSIGYKANDTLRFAHKSGSTWSIEAVESGSSSYGTFASLAYDPLTGYPTIAHGAGVTTGIRFVRWDGFEWVPEIAASGVASYPSLAYDAAGVAAISYLVAPGPNGYMQLWFARRTGCSGTCWSDELIQDFSPVQLGWRTSLAFSSTGAPSISFGDYTNRDLKFATQVP